MQSQPNSKIFYWTGGPVTVKLLLDLQNFYWTSYYGKKLTIHQGTVDTDSKTKKILKQFRDHHRNLVHFLPSDMYADELQELNADKNIKPYDDL